MIQEHIFRAYDIRGIYGRDLTRESAFKIGRAISTYLNGEGRNVIVGRDVRTSGEALENALIDGLIEGGCNVEDLGVVTTPILYFSTFHYSRDCGVMVTASHNPPEWNGFKILTSEGFICEGRGMEDIKEIAVKGRFNRAEPGEKRRRTEALQDYKEYVLGKIGLDRELKAVLDPGNGSCSLLMPDLYQEAGIESTILNPEPDGNFPARSPNITDQALKEISRVVLEEKADFGVGFDGDGDRCAFVDDKGRIVPENTILIILAEHYLKERRGAPIVYEVSCSMSVEEAIRSLGGKPIVSRIGHTYIYERMIHEGAVFGGESSGHFYYADLYGFDDAIFTSLKIAEVISKSNRRFSEIVDSIPTYPLARKTFDCPDEKKFNVVERLKQDFMEYEGYKVLTIDGVKVIGSDGWFLIRPSNTQPQIKLTVEAKSRRRLEELMEIAEDKIYERI